VYTYLAKHLQSITTLTSPLPENGVFWQPFFMCLHSSVHYDHTTLTSRMVIFYYIITVFVRFSLRTCYVWRRRVEQRESRYV